jgi:bifunctional N-acetylglucosamine-1-phosphate-uridyltransferase/glucosamine-1-phosphate-acetyltransferase GlmU-like protein
MNEKLNFNNEFNAHQGDVQIHSLANLPEGVKKLEKTFFAKSEKTGHAHALCGDYELFETKSGSRIIVVGDKGATLNHTKMENLTKEYWDTNEVLPIADHKPTILKQGIYHVGIQRRINPYKNVWEKVKD